MRSHRNKSQLLFLFLAVGFLLGIVYENMFSKNSVVMSEIFLRTNLEQYLQADIISEKYFWYVAKARILLFAIVCGLSFFRWKKLFVGLCLTICGFFAGSVTVAAVMQLGMKGILLCVVGSLPQGIFYGMMYSLLFIYWIHYPESRWNRTKTIFVIFMFLLGVILETYVNPILLKMVVAIAI